jgi:hypothetical protein
VRSADIKFVEAEISQQRSELARRYVAPMEEWAELVVDRYKLPPDALQPLMFGLAQVRLQRLEAAREWLVRGPVEEIRSVAEKGASASHVDEPPVQLQVSVQGSGARLSELLPAFLEIMTTEQGWRGQTLAQNTTTYRLFIAHCGDRAPSGYTRSDLTGFYDSGRSRAAYGRCPDLRALAPAEIVERMRGQPGERLTMKTVKRHFSALGRLFTYLKRRGEITGTSMR